MIDTILEFLKKPIHVVLVIYGIAVLIQLFYIFRYYLQAGIYKSTNVSSGKTPVSVIVCAKNEAHNLADNLPEILKQDYPEYEVIVVDDGSEDNTSEVLHNLSKQYKHLRFTSITEDKKFTHGKKLAVTVGVKSAKNEWLLFTDADCKPATNQWIRKMSAEFTDDTSIVLGYGAYQRKKGVLNHIIRFDTLQIAMNYLSAALAGKPYMGVGRNLAYRKSLFFKNKGFAGHYHLLSGDDDLFVNQTATSENTRVVIDKEAFTISSPKQSVSDWIKQKRRHLTTGKYYKPKHKFFLGFEIIWRYIFYLLFILLMIQYSFWYVVLGMFALRLISYLTTIKIVMNRLKERDLFLTSPLLEIILPILYLVLSISNNITGKNNRWK